MNLSIGNNRFPVPLSPFDGLHQYMTQKCLKQAIRGIYIFADSNLFNYRSSLKKSGRFSAKAKILQSVDYELDAWSSSTQIPLSIYYICNFWT